MKKQIKKHEKYFIHVPYKYYFPVVLIAGIIVFLYLSSQAWQSDVSIKNMLTEIMKNNNHQFLYLNLSIVLVIGIIIEVIIAFLTNGIEKFKDGLLFGLFIGLLGGLLGGLFFGLLGGLVEGLVGLLDGEDTER